MTLNELTEDFLRLQLLASDPDTDPQTLADTMESIEGELEYKADGYAKVLNNIGAESSALKGEIERLSARKKVLDNSATRIKKALESAMIATGKTKFKTTLFSFNIQKNPASLKLAEDLNFDELPMEFVIFPKPEIDKEAVKKAIKEGAEYEWAHLEQSESLRIR